MRRRQEGKGEKKETDLYGETDKCNPKFRSQFNYQYQEPNFQTSLGGNVGKSKSHVHSPLGGMSETSQETPISTSDVVGPGQIWACWAGTCYQF